MNESGVPAVGYAPPVVNASLLAAAGRTLTFRAPVIDAVAVSVAVMVCAPATKSVAENVPWPFVRVAFAGNTVPVDVSVLVKCTVPAYPVSVLPAESCAVTVNEKAAPAVGVAVVARTR